MVLKNKVTLLLASSLLLCASSLLAKSEIEKAEAAHQQGQLSLAISHYQRALDEGTSSAASEFNLLRLYLAEQRLSDAQRLLEKLAQEQANNVEYMQLQGDLARQLNDWENARNWYQQALAANVSGVDQAVLQLKLGQALQQSGDQTAADKAFAEYARLEGISQMPKVTSADANNSDNSRKEN